MLTGENACMSDKDIKKNSSLPPDNPPDGLTLQQRLELLPTDPGVYLFRDSREKVIYVGKAKNLRSRVRSYFSGRDDGRYQFASLVKSIVNLDTIVTDNEVEALILEKTLIRRHRPRFNVDVREVTTYPYLKVTKEPYSRVFMTRKPREDGSKYYGPLSDVTRAKDTVSALRKACHIRTCNLNITEESIRQKKHRVCLEYHIGNCLGPCEGLVSREQYVSELRHLVNAVNGRGQDLIAILEERMKAYSDKLEFEEAARVRDQIEQTKALGTRQKVITLEDINRDVFAFVQEDRDGCMAVLRMQHGRIIGRTHSFLTRAEGHPRGELWTHLLADFYLQHTREVPDEIFLPEPLEGEEANLLQSFLDERAEHKVRIVIPQKGEKVRLLELAKRNAELLLTERREAKAREERLPHSLKMLAEHLKLEQPPRFIECFDNSNLFGQQPVAAMVRFKDARPEKSQYRHFKIKTVTGIDDFASMQEVVGRRYRRMLSENSPLPDLVLIDGGVGQVNAARRVLDALELKHLPCVGLAKRLEEIVYPGGETITLPRTSSALKLLMQIRDETHRFAITFHRKLHQSAQISSTLESLPGIGNAKAQALLKHFGSLKRLKEASAQQIAEVPGFSVKGGEELLRRLHGGEEAG
ncbi:MAG: excinuclease ABC subunit UvrC, partial [bacterium]